MEYLRTVRVPFHYKTNRGKIEETEDLTARLTHAVRLWSKIIDENEIETRKELQNLNYQHEVQKKTKLSTGFVQQTGNKALWIWNKYRDEHDKWEWMLDKAKKGSEWHEKLKRREPSKPFSSKRSKLKKTPTRFDYRTGEIKEVDNLKLTNWIMKISILEKYEKLVIPLNPSEYHKKMLKKGKIRDFEIVWNQEREKFMVHITCLFKVQDQTPEKVRGIDLGIRRYASEVLMVGDPLKLDQFSYFKGEEKLERLKELNDRISHLKREEKWEVLKKLRSKRRRVAEYYDRKYTKQIVEKFEKELIIVGNPRYIRYNKFRGNGNKVERKVLQNWSFARIIQFLKESSEEKGLILEDFLEWKTSSHCHKCGGEVIRDPVGKITCKNCGMQYDSDYNACIKIIQDAGSSSDVKSLELRQQRAGAIDELALNWR